MSDGISDARREERARRDIAQGLDLLDRGLSEIHDAVFGLSSEVRTRIEETLARYGLTVGVTAVYHKTDAEVLHDCVVNPILSCGCAKGTKSCNVKHRQHTLKTWPGAMQAIELGSKKYEIRTADRDYRVGDILLLQEWDSETRAYTGRERRVLVTYMTNPGEWGLPLNMCVMSIADAPPLV